MYLRAMHGDSLTNKIYAEKAMFQIKIPATEIQK